MYDTVEEARQKLKQTIIMKGEEPVWVLDAGGQTGAVQLVYREFGQENTKSISIENKSLDMKDVGTRLGYINIPNHKGFGLSVYSRRMPVRIAHSTQGLSDKNVRINYTRYIKDIGLTEYPYKLAYLEGKGLKETLQKKYPSLDATRYRLSRETNLYDIAFDPCLCICKEGNSLFKLRYKGIEIGWTDDLHTFRIEPKFRYLDELFIEDHNMKVRS